MNSVPQVIRERVEKLTRNATRAELALLRPLEILGERHDLTVEFQKPMKLGHYRYCIVDIMVAGKLALEIDGKGHQESDQIVRDKARDARLSQLGYRVLRLTNAHVRRDPVGLAHLLVRKLLESRGADIQMTPGELSDELARATLASLGLSA